MRELEIAGSGGGLKVYVDSDEYKVRYESYNTSIIELKEPSPTRNLSIVIDASKSPTCDIVIKGKTVTMSGPADRVWTGIVVYLSGYDLILKDGVGIRLAPARGEGEYATHTLYNKSYIDYISFGQPFKVDFILHDNTRLDVSEKSRNQPITIYAYNEAYCGIEHSSGIEVYAYDNTTIDVYDNEHKLKVNAYDNSKVLAVDITQLDINDESKLMII